MDRKVIAIDIGGTKISLAVVSGGKFVSEVTKFSTPKTAQAIFDNILDNISTFLNLYPIYCILRHNSGTRLVDL